MDRISFKWLPYYCSNDLVHGSWWFCIGSSISTIIPIIPILDSQYNFFYIPIKTDLDAFDQNITYLLMVLSGLCFTLGSYALVRSFEYPIIKPLLKSFFFYNDLILSGWLFLLGSIPFTPYSALFIYWYPNEFNYYIGFIFSFLFTAASIVFLHACYSSNEGSTQYVYPTAVYIFGKSNIVKRYFYNDWIAVSWFCYLCTFIWLIGSIVMLILCLPEDNQRKTYLYSSSAFNALIYLIGCAYYCTGATIPHLLTFRSNFSQDLNSQTDDIDDSDLLIQLKNRISNNIV